MNLKKILIQKNIFNINFYIGNYDLFVLYVILEYLYNLIYNKEIIFI